MHYITKSRRPTAIGIDLGTANTIAVGAGLGVLFDQPTVCCFQAFDAVPRFIAAGREASSYVGKVSKPLKIIRPLKNGVLSDMTAARELLNYVRKSVAPKRIFSKLVPVIGVPADATESERRALANAARDAGFGEPALVPEPLLAAIGLGLDVEQARGRMLVDCGAGTTEVVVISLGGICVSKSVRGGGEGLDQGLVDYLNFHHRFQIGSREAESMKLQLSDAFAAEGSSRWIEVRGLDTASGLPRLLSVPADDLLPTWLRYVDQIVHAVRAALRETPPELSHDILEDGITLTGGGALSALLSQRIAIETGVQTHVADAPTRSVSRGLEHVLQSGSRVASVIA